MALKLSQLNQNEYQLTSQKTGSTQSLPGRLISSLSNIGVGIGSAIGKTGLGLGQAALKGSQFVAGQIHPSLSGFADPLVRNIENIKENVFEKPFEEELATTSGRIGSFTGDTASFLSPTRGIVGAQQFLQRTIPASGRAANTLRTAVSRGVPEAVGTGVIEAGRTGGDFEQAQGVGLLAGGLSVGFGGLGALARATYFPELRESVTKALGIQGKSSGGQTLQEVGKKVGGLSVIKKYAPEIKVRDADGNSIPFNPSEATYDTTLQAWNTAREKVFAAYNSLAQKAGDETTVNLQPVLDDLAAILSQPRMAQYKGAARSLIRDLSDSFEDATQADIKAVQTFLKDLNANTTASFFKGTSDNAAAEINAGTARTLADLLDDVITNTTGQKYSALRAEYGALKSIEDDLVRRFKQAARQIGGGLHDYMDILNSGELIAGVISANPALIASGATRGILTNLRRILANPERFLRRAFDLLDEQDTAPIIHRMFGGVGSRPLSPLEQRLSASPPLGRGANPELRGGMPSA